MNEVVLGQYIGIPVPAKITGKEREDYVVDAIVKASQVRVPEDVVIERAKSMVEEYGVRLNQQGLSIEAYYKSANTDEKALIKKMRGIARNHLKGRAVLEAIAKKEKIVATEEEYDRELEKLSVRYLISTAEVRKIMQGREADRLRNDIVVKKALDFVLENVAETEGVSE